MAEGSQFELMVRFRFGTALHGKAPEKNRLITAHPDLFGETGYLCGRVIGAFWAGKLAFSLENKINEPAWRAKPSSYLIAVDDKMIPPDAQRAMAGATVVEV